MFNDKILFFGKREHDNSSFRQDRSLFTQHHKGFFYSNRIMLKRID